ncbi:hypothetical protein K0M31_006393, partial [Melipona bicolor]
PRPEILHFRNIPSETIFARRYFHRPLETISPSFLVDFRRDTRRKCQDNSAHCRIVKKNDLRKRTEEICKSRERTMNCISTIAVKEDNSWEFESEF